MSIYRYIHCAANGRWKFRKFVPQRYQKFFAKKELKITLASLDVYGAAQEAMNICRNFYQVLHNIDMNSNDDPDHSLTALVTVNSLTKRKDGSVSVQGLSFDANDPKDQAEVLALLNLK